MEIAVAPRACSLANSCASKPGSLRISQADVLSLNPSGITQCLAATPQAPRLLDWRFQSSYKYPRRLYASKYDDLAWVHVDLYEYIHDGDMFLPWRWSFSHFIRMCT